MTESMDQALALPAIVQGAIGSALFWLILQLIVLLAKKLPLFTGKVRQRLEKDSCLREYIYRKYTSRNGLLYFTQGFFVSFSEALSHIVQGLLFICISLLSFGLNRVAFSIALIGAIYFFWRALAWLIPSTSWVQSNTLENWKRVECLEQQLYKKVGDDTIEFLSKATTEHDNEVKQKTELTKESNLDQVAR